MDKREAIEYLKDRLSEIPKLARLPYNNDEYPLWHKIIEGILDEVFGQGSSESQNFFSTYSEIDFLGAKEDYLEQLKRCETALLSIIKKYEILGIETKPAAIKEPKDTAELPNYLFDKMQFHPRVITASKSLFRDGHYAQAILEAFKAVENFVQDKSGLTLYGTNLMETVFNEENPIIKVPEAGHYYKDVQRGFKHLFIGAAQGIRNPKAHKEIIQKDPYITLQYLGFASFLLKRIDYWEAGVS